MAESLQPPDGLHLQVAQGWLELGNLIEAQAELDKIALSQRDHPDVLSFRWEICAAANKWDAALSVAATLIRVEPESAAGWIHRSYALHELKRTVEARDNLLRVVEKFSSSATIRYNLACYECQLARLDQARNWLGKAFAIGDASQMKLAALDDPDLEPLWREIENS
jgi:predicted Zn-dependent protease